MADNELFGNSEQLNDTISRAAVVDEIEGVDWYHINRNGEMVHGANDAEHQAWYKADDIYAAIERVPPAQPVAKDINVPVKDCISRQAALGALGERPVVWSDNDDYTLGARNQYDMDRLALETVPFAQQWIPCKTALPEKRKYVLCQCRAGIMDVLRLTDDNDWYKDSTHIYMHSFVVAWCPLPEPWKGEKE